MWKWSYFDSCNGCDSSNLSTNIGAGSLDALHVCVCAVGKKHARLLLEENE